jgi:protein-S-isoprenylcysteine O-methyltransferase Ste14
MRFLALIYGLVAYVAFLASLVYLLLFLGYFVVPVKYQEQLYSQRIFNQPLRAIDAEGSGRADDALWIDLLLLAAFVVPHSVMARDGFKRAWTKVVPQPIERSTYVLISSLLLLLLFTYWKPIPENIWPLAGSILSQTNERFRIAFQVMFYFGAALVLLSSFMIDHFELTGLRQVWSYFRG